MDDALLEREEETILYVRARWILLIIFASGTIVSSILWLTFAPIPAFAAQIYGVSESQIAFICTLFLAVYVPASIMVVYLFRCSSLRSVLLLGLALNTACATIRYCGTLDNPSYELILFGTGIGALAQPMFSNTAVRVAHAWFPIEERDVATAIGIMSGPVGLAIGMLLPTVFVGDSQTVSDRGTGLLRMQFAHIVICGCLFVAGFIGFPSDLPKKIEKAHISVTRQFLQCFTDTNFLLLLVTFSVEMGVFTALLTSMAQLMDKAGYTMSQATMFSDIMILIGILSSIVCGSVLDRYHCYNEALQGLLSLGLGITLILLLLIRPGNGVGLGILFGLLGMCILPVLPISFECAVQCTHPVKEELSNGILMSFGQLISMIMTLVFAKLIESQKPYGDTYQFEPVYLLIVGALGIATICAWLYNGPYLRLMDENVVGCVEFEEDMADLIRQHGRVTRELSHSDITSSLHRLKLGDIVEAITPNGCRFAYLSICKLEIQTIHFQSREIIKMDLVVLQLVQ